MWGKVPQKGWIFWSRLNLFSQIESGLHILYSILSVEIGSGNGQMNKTHPPPAHRAHSAGSQQSVWWYFVMPSPLQFPHLNTLHTPELWPVKQIFLHKYFWIDHQTNKPFLKYLCLHNILFWMVSALVCNLYLYQFPNNWHCKCYKISLCWEIVG